jgi:hypothetical protein
VCIFDFHHFFWKHIIMDQKILPDIFHTTITKTTFNSLPREVITVIFCNVDSQYLFYLKDVCSYWYSIVTELLNFKKVEISDERIAGAVHISEILAESTYPIIPRSSSVYQAPYVIANVVIPAVINHWSSHRRSSIA